MAENKEPSDAIPDTEELENKTNAELIEAIRENTKEIERLKRESRRPIGILSGGPDYLKKTSRLWNARRQDCERVGMRVIQDGDCEGTLLFDPENKDQARTAIRLVGAYRKPQLTPEQRAAKAETLKRNIEASRVPIN